MYSTSDLKKGVILDLEGAPHLVEHTQTSSPTARGGNTIHRVKLRNLKTKQRIEKSFRSGDTFPPADVERTPVEYLYDDPDAFHFMDQESYEQFQLNREDLEWEKNFLIEGIEGVKAIYYNGSPMALELPTSINLEIVETAPAAKGNSATSRPKPAKLQTGFEVQVPEHIDQGIRVSVDTRTGEFLGRAKD
ncbi:MAG: elongation factor P [Planctomycetota bacterium]